MISRPEDFNELNVAIEELKKLEDSVYPSEEEINQAREQGLKYLQLNISAEVKIKRSDLYKKMNALLKDPVEGMFGGSNLSIEENIEIYDYEYLMRKSIRTHVENEFEIKISDLAIKEQFYFLNLIKTKTESEIEDVKSFTKKYGKVGFKTFLSLEQDPTLGDRIISFGENAGSGIAQKVFEKYSEIIDQTFEIEKFIAEEINSSNLNRKQILEIRDSLMVRAKDVLIQFIDAFEFAKRKNIELSGEEVEAQLEKIKTDTLLLASTLRTIKNSTQKINLEDVKNMSLESDTESANVNDDDKNEMFRIYSENYSSLPGVQQKLLKSLEDSLDSDKSHFAILRYKGKLTGFYRFDEISEDELHLAAFNLDSEFRGSGLGEAMMLEKLDQLSQEKSLVGECNAHARIGAKYIDKGV